MKNYETTFTIIFRGKSKLNHYGNVAMIGIISTTVASFIAAFKRIHPDMEVIPTQQTITSDEEIEVGKSKEVKP